MPHSDVRTRQLGKSQTKTGNDILKQNLRTELADIIGKVESSGGRGRKSGEAFRRALFHLKKRHKK